MPKQDDESTTAFWQRKIRNAILEEAVEVIRRRTTPITEIHDLQLIAAIMALSK